MRRREFIAGLGVAIMPAMRFLPARAQQVPVIGVLSSASFESMRELVATFHQGLAEIGYVEGSRAKRINLLCAYCPLNEHGSQANSIAMGCMVQRKGSLMRRRDFIAGLGGAATWPLKRKKIRPKKIGCRALRC